MDEELRREYQSLLRSIIDQAEAMSEPDEEEEMLYDKVENLSLRVEELQELIDRAYA